MPNGGFETDPIGSTTVTNWDTSGAPNSTFTITANDVYLFGSQVLQWSVAAGITAPQVIKSSPIPIPLANRVYTASMATSCLGTNYLTFHGATIRLDVVDSVTGQTMANFIQSDAAIWHGDSPNESFVPLNTDPVYLQVTLLPLSGSYPTNIKVDRAALAQSMDYGILASSIWRSGLSTFTGSTRHGGSVDARR